MTKKKAREEIIKLRETIRYYRYAYHVLDKSLISDDALDSLKHRLFLLEQQYPDLVSPDSPTQRIGGAPLKKFTKVKHARPMLSIEDLFSAQELEEWWRYVQKLVSPKDNSKWPEFFCEPKIDGLAVDLIYSRGVLMLASTRGNGYIGENITANARTIEAIPLKLKLYQPLSSKKIQKRLEYLIKNGKIEVRGEIYLSKIAFAKINKARIKRGEKPYANSRNLAAGSVRQLNSKITRSRHLSFLAWDLVTDLGQTKHSEKHIITKAIGFKTDLGKLCFSLDEVVKFWKKIQKERNKLPYPIDGVVVNINDDRIFKSLGVAGKSPRGVRALKFPPLQAVTKIKDVIIQIGRTGAATPVAILEPVQVGGTVITRATLHNANEIKRLGIKIGDMVIVGRAGDVIPAVIKVLVRMRKGDERPFIMPKKCPVCGARLVRKEGQVIWYCPNSACPARRKNFLEHFTSKKSFDIRGLGPEIIEQLREKELISQPVDIFRLTQADLLSLEGFGEKSAQNLIQAVRDSKVINFSKFIFALGIPQVGEKTARLLAERFKDLSALQGASLEELTALPDIGPQTAQAIFRWFRNSTNLKMIHNLLQEGIKINFPRIAKKKLWTGKRFVLTGTLKKFSRDKAIEEIRKRGGEILTSISKNVDFLICGQKPGSKLQKARQKGVEIIDESRFIKMLASTSK